MAAQIWLLSFLMVIECVSQLQSFEDQRLATRPQCSIQNQQMDPDCDEYYSDVIIPSRWNGNYTCADDNSLVNISLTFGKSRVDTLDVVASMNINNNAIQLLGNYASFFRSVTLQNENRIQPGIFGREVTNFELNGRLSSPSYINGVVILNNGYTCPVELRRELKSACGYKLLLEDGTDLRNMQYCGEKGQYIDFLEVSFNVDADVLEQTDWCNGHGQCYRYGMQKDQYICCCDQGYTGHTCLSSITFPVTTTSTTATPSSVPVANTSDSTATTAKASTFSSPSTASTANKPTTIAQGVTLGNAIHPRCTSYGWDIVVDMSVLKQLFPGISSSHIYFGDTSCRGRINGTVLIFQQGFRDCLTAERVANDMFIYENVLFYAIHDPIRPFIIRQHNWTFGVECDVSRAEATAFHVHHVVDAYHVAVSGHYNISTSFFKDENFMEKISGNLINAGVGDNIYVKIFTTTDDWTIKMRLHTCYTRPTDVADNKLTYFLIKNGCEVDSTTHIISQTTHETKFIFQNFEYSSNHEGFNVFCNATFCNTDDNSAMCSQSCQ